MTTYVALSADEVARALSGLSGWAHDGDRLKKTFKFSSFGSAIRFMAACVPDIDRLDHHPTWSNTYSTVSVELTSHDIGNRVSQHDLDVAKAIEGVLAREGQALGYMSA